MNEEEEEMEYGQATRHKYEIRGISNLGDIWAEVRIVISGSNNMTTRMAWTACSLQYYVGNFYYVTTLFVNKKLVSLKRLFVIA